MNSVDKLVKLAERFARKLSLGQQVVNEVDLVEKALTDAGLFGPTALPKLNSIVSPMLNQAGVADDASVTITFTVEPNLNIKFHVATSPPAAAIKLAQLLRSKFGPLMKAALQKAKVSLTAPVDSNWMTF